MTGPASPAFTVSSDGERPIYLEIVDRDFLDLWPEWEINPVFHHSEMHDWFLDSFSQASDPVSGTDALDWDSLLGTDSESAYPDSLFGSDAEDPDSAAEATPAAQSPEGEGDEVLDVSNMGADPAQELRHDEAEECQEPDLVNGASSSTHTGYVSSLLPPTP